MLCFLSIASVLLCYKLIHSVLPSVLLCSKLMHSATHLPCLFLITHMINLDENIFNKMKPYGRTFACVKSKIYLCSALFTLKEDFGLANDH